MAKISLNIDDKLLEGLKRQSSENKLDIEDLIEKYVQQGLINKEVENMQLVNVPDDIMEKMNSRSRELNCNPEKLIAMIKNVSERNKKRSAQGKKITAIDERYFKKAENNLYTELAFALGRDKQEMQTVIADHLESIAQ